MHLLESSVAAAFTLGSAGCVLDLLVPGGASARRLFVTCLLVICVLSTFALWSVEGRHACWHHGCPGGVTGEKQVAAAEAEATRAPPVSCPNDDGLVDAATSDGDELPSEEFPLERRSSFVELALRIHG